MSRIIDLGLFIQRSWNRLGRGGAPTGPQELQAHNFHNLVLHEKDSHLPPSVAQAISQATRANTTRRLGPDFVAALEAEHAAEPPHDLGIPKP